MMNRKTKIEWEWPAGRTVESKCLVTITKITQASRGFLGIGQSPSLANALPDATDVEATVVSGHPQQEGAMLTLRLPGVEAAKLAVGRYAGLGLIGDGTVCVCVAQIPAKDRKDAQAWLESWICQ